MAANPDADKPIAELTQKTGPFARQEAVLHADRVALRFESPWRSWRHRVHLHNTKERLDYLRSPITVGGVAGLVVLTILTVLVWPLLPWLVSFVHRFLQARKGVYVLAYGNRLDQIGRPLSFPMFVLPSDNPSPEAVQKFLAALAEAHKAHSRKLQTMQSETHYITEIKQFHDLRQEGVLNEDEFSAIKAELLGMREKKIGF
jgi:hypothetical protein